MILLWDSCYSSYCKMPLLSNVSFPRDVNWDSRIDGILAEIHRTVKKNVEKKQPYHLFYYYGRFLYTLIHIVQEGGTCLTKWNIGRNLKTNMKTCFRSCGPERWRYPLLSGTLGTERLLQGQGSRATMTVLSENTKSKPLQLASALPNICFCFRPVI